MILFLYGLSISKQNEEINLLYDEIDFTFLTNQYKLNNQARKILVDYTLNISIPLRTNKNMMRFSVEN
jgi:sulfatase maturation enzyme AslB (radical SAM superfamily)